MNRIILDFFKVGTLRFVARAFFGLRGLFIVVSLAPDVLGEYTIWLLFIFYFSMLDFGVLASLERDIPHYRGLGEAETAQKKLNLGWSAFFSLSGSASLLLMMVSFFVFKEWVLSLLLGAYLLSDKYYRAYYVNSRIHLLYRENGIAELIYAVVSLLLILVILPHWGPYGILVGFIIAAVVGALYLCQKARLLFFWILNIKDFIECIRSAFPLAVVIYSMQFYHMLALTILAFTCNKLTLGYFAFAFRIFYICLAIFPFLIREIMRTRMYFQVAQKQKEKPYLETLFYPMGVYCILTSLFWILVYWWADWGINWIAPKYLQSLEALKVLTLALLPLGIAKICSDYLCSNVHKKTKTVIKVWLFGISFQGIFIFFLSINQSNLLLNIPIVYLISTFLIYILITTASLRVEGEVFPKNLRLIFLWTPLIGAFSVVYIFKKFLHLAPSYNFNMNVAPFLTSFILTIALIRLVIFLFKKYKTRTTSFSSRA